MIKTRQKRNNFSLKKMTGGIFATQPSIWKFLSHFSHLKTKSFRPGTAYLVVWLRIQHSISAATLKGPAISINDYLLWKHFWLASLIEISCMLLFIFRCSPTACQKWKTSLESALPLGPCCRMLCTPTYFQLFCMGDCFSREQDVHDSWGPCEDQVQTSVPDSRSCFLDL